MTNPNVDNLTIHNFFTNYIFHPQSEKLSSNDRKIATAATILLGIVSLGIIHGLIFTTLTLSSLSDKTKKNPPANSTTKKMGDVFQEKIPINSAEPLTRSVTSAKLDRLLELVNKYNQLVHSDELRVEIHKVQEFDFIGKKIVRRTPNNEGDLLLQVGMDKEITIEKKDPYYPEYKIKIGEVAFYVSKPIKYPNFNRPLVFSLIEDTNNKNELRGQFFYFSNSHGIWRNIATIVKRGEKLGHICKGHSEADTAAPAILNILLLELQDNQLNVKEQVPPNLFQSSPIDYFAVQTRGYTEAVQDIYGKIAGSFNLEGVTTTRYKNNILEDKNSHPNFLTSISYETSNDHYKKVRYHLYSSQDKNFVWTYCEILEGEMKGKVFLANVDLIKASITAYGNRAQYVPDKFNNEEDIELTAPLIEYHNQIKQEDFPNGNFPNTGLYQCNWNHVRKNPLIEAWYQNQNQELPDVI